MARTVWTDRGARQETATRTVWTDYGAYQETIVSGNLRAYPFNNVNTFGTSSEVANSFNIKGILSASGLSIGSSTSLTGFAVVEVGDLVVVNTHEAAASATTSAVVDNLGHTYTSSSTNRVWYLRVTTPGTLTTITTTVTASANDFAHIAVVFKGPFATSPIDASPTGVSDTSSPFTGPATGTLTQANELVVAVLDLQRGQTDVVATAPFVSPSALTQLSAADDAVSSCSATIAYRLVNSTASVTPQFTITAGTITAGVLTTHTFKLDLAAAQTLTATIYADPDSFGTAVVSQAGVTQTLTQTRYVDPDTFKAHTVSRGAVTLTATRYADPDTFKAHTVSRGAVTLTATRYADPDTFKAHTVSRGAVTLTATRYADPDVFGVPIVQNLGGGAQQLFTVRLQDPDTFNPHTIGVGPVALTGARYVDPDSFKSHSISVGRVTLTQTLYTDPDSFKVHAITTGSATLAETRYVDPDTFKAHFVSRGTISLQPTRYADPDTFKPHTISRGAVTLTTTRFVDPDSFKAHTITGATNLQTTRYIDPDTFKSHLLRAYNVLVESKYVDPDIFYTAHIITSDTQNIHPARFINTPDFGDPLIGWSGPFSILGRQYAVHMGA